jgi:RNA recognition motif-containing protein
VPLVQNESAQEDPTKTKLYVGNISFETTVEELEVQFSQFGKLHDCYIPRFPEGNSRGFAFVTLDSEVADAAMEATNGMELNGRSVAVSKSLSPNEKKQQSPSNKRASYAKSTKIYIGNLSYETDEGTLRPIFEELGTVHDFYMPMDQDYDGQNRGFAFATMPEEEASRAIDELNDVEVDGRMIRVNEAQQRA